jgi:hypothetical protein
MVSFSDRSKDVNPDPQVSPPVLTSNIRSNKKQSPLRKSLTMKSLKTSEKLEVVEMETISDVKKIRK